MMAKALEENGATVYLIGRRQELLDQVAAEAVRSPKPPFPDVLW